MWSDFEIPELTVDPELGPQAPFAMPTTYYTPGRGLVSQDEGGSASRTFYHGDQVGSTRLLTGPAGSGPGGEGVSAAYASYTAFGEHVGAGAIGESPAGLGVRYGFCGQWGYQTAGLNPQGFMLPGGSVAGTYDFGYVHVGARYYDPAVGRFLQRDPIGLFGGFNVYAYCANNPVSHVDPTGRAALGPKETAWIAIVVTRFVVVPAATAGANALAWVMAKLGASRFGNAVRERVVNLCIHLNKLRVAELPKAGPPPTTPVASTPAPPTSPIGIGMDDIFRLTAAPIESATLAENAP
ncbi:MAG: RHS repeat-associated core domain-containing protein [Phycisphaerales bacterium]|nr:RHS repeat-associated core domain-containing protein [Phycisphaerales bacterium]